MFRIDQLILTNYRCFKDFKIDFDPRMTVLTAANGQGKTAVLDAIGLSLTPLLAEFPEVYGRHIRPDDVYLDNQGSNSEALYPCRVEVRGQIAGEPASWARELRSYKGRTTNRDAQALTRFGRRIADLVKARDGSALPLVAHYGTDRLWNSIKLTTGKKAANVGRSRLAGYVDCLNPASNFKWVQDWLGRTLMDAREAQEARDLTSSKDLARQLRWISNVIRDFLKHVLPVDVLRYSWKRAELIVVSENRPLSVEQLSDGTRIVLGLVADLAHRAIRLNPHLTNPIEATSGLVLLDEVDLHLHPQWQQQLVNQLQTSFPGLQFILTSHSPQVVSTVSRGQVRMIREYDALSPEVETYAGKASSVLERVFCVDSRPPLEVVSRLIDYLKRVQMGQGLEPESIQMRQYLETRLGVEDPDLLRADAMLARQKVMGGLGA